MMITGWRWLLIFISLRVDGHIYPGLWGGKVQTPGPQEFFKVFILATLLFVL